MNLLIGTIIGIVLQKNVDIYTKSLDLIKSLIAKIKG